MAALKQIKTKIRSVQKTRTVTKAMEAVSAVKMRKSQQKALMGRAYARAAAATLARVAGSRALTSHPLVTERPVARALYIIITSDKGLAGALNSGVLRAAQRDMTEHGLTFQNTEIYAVGRKAAEFFFNRHFTSIKSQSNGDHITSDLVSHIVNEAAGAFLREEVDIVKVVYQNFISTFEQRPTLRTVFPLSLDELQKVVADIVPAKGAYAQQSTPAEANPASYTIEPSEEEVLAVILPKLAGVILYHALLESQASEHSARMVAMKGASDKAGELTHTLTLQFNKARQAAITREVSEITGGMEAMAS